MGSLPHMWHVKLQTLLKRDVEASKEPVSKWAAEAIRQRLRAEWPADTLALLGSWKDNDFPDAAELREGLALDANAVIHALKAAGRVRQRMETVSPRDLAIPAIVAYELEFGTMRSKLPEERLHQLRSVLRVVTILPFEERAGRQSAQVRLRLEEFGETIGPLNLLIAGTVLAYGAILVTHNAREFRRVPGLNVEDWF